MLTESIYVQVDSNDANQYMYLDQTQSPGYLWPPKKIKIKKIYHLILIHYSNILLVRLSELKQ